MIRFNIDGKYLDLYNATKLQFERKNSVFGFDEIELSRSASFDIPRTANNDAIFNDAANVAKYGAEARRRIAVQMQYSGGAVDGYLHVTAANETAYSVCFTFGMLLGLKALKETGKIGDIVRTMIDFSAAIDWNNGVNIRPATASEAEAYYTYFNPFYYLPYIDELRGYWWQTSYIDPFPSFALCYVTDMCLQALGVTLQRNETKARYAQYRCVIPDFRNEQGAAMSIEQARQTRLLMRYNLPDVTVVDLMKTECALLGKQLTYNNGVIAYETPVLDAWNIRDITRLVGWGSVERTFKDYAQRNKYIFDNDAYVGNDAAESVYAIDNVNIDAEKTIYKMPFNGGGIATRDKFTEYGQVSAAVVHDADLEVSSTGVTKFKATGKRHTLLSCVSTETGEEVYMQRARFGYNSTLAALLDASTKATVTVPMSLREFNDMPERVLLNIRGVFYVWTAMQWGEGAATITMQKIKR